MHAPISQDAATDFDSVGLERSHLLKLFVAGIAIVALLLGASACGGASPSGGDGAREAGRTPSKQTIRTTNRTTVKKTMVGTTTLITSNKARTTLAPTTTGAMTKTTWMITT
jgi:hypothetical protein